MRPPDLIYSAVAALLIIVPSSQVLFYTNIQLFGMVGGIIADVFYFASIFNLCRLIKKCAYTEPGVIPAIPSQRSQQLRV